jgi:hypothetical protein
MKTPTTPYLIEIQEKAQITRNYLESQGWKLIQEKPLFDSFEHTKNADLRCSIGLYGGFSLVELHWVNKTPEREFSTINNELTIDDYHTIIRLLKIRV